MKMTRSMPRSRDDFPINAFALLPPPPSDDNGDSYGLPAVSLEPPDPVQADRSPADADVSPLNGTQFKLTREDIRSAIESLYRQNERLQHENISLRRENSSLVDSQQRVKEEAAKAEEKLRNQLKTLDQEALQLHQKAHEVERGKERVTAEKEELRVRVEEQDATIAELQDALKELEQQRCGERSSSASEIARLEMLWASTEQSRTEKAAQARQATATVERLSKTLRKQLEQVHDELRVAEKDYETFRRFLAGQPSLCAGEGQFGSSTHDNHDANEAELVRKKLQTLEEQNLELTTHNNVLLTKCTEYEKSVRLLNRRLDEFNSKHAANTSLLKKYEVSAADGTQTIAELQESLVKLCDQLADERQSHQTRLQEQLRIAMDKEHGLQEELSEMKNHLQEVRRQLDDIKQNAGNKDASPCKHCQAELSNHDSRCTAVTMHSPVPGVKETVKVTQESQHRPVSSNVIDLDRDEIEDDTESPPTVPPPLSLPEQNREGVSKNKRRVETTQAATTCRLCNEEPFGFMMRCQKCKDPFHAGCVKNNATGGKKRLGHIFKCANCAPQRPTKVARVATPASISPSSPAPNAHVTPTPASESTPRIIARPAPPKVD